MRALELGLVDHLGSRRDAIQAAARLAGLDHWQPQTISRSLSVQERLLKQLTGSAIRLRTESWLAALLPGSFHRPATQLKWQLKSRIGVLNDPNALYLHCFGCVPP